MVEYELEQLVLPTEAVTLAEAKAACRVLHDDEDDFIQHLVDSATALIDGPFGYLGRAIITQQWRASFPRGSVSGGGALALPFGPVESIDTIKTFDGTTLSADLKADFELFGRQWAPVIKPKSGINWPSLADRPDALQVEFTAGAAAAAAPVKQAILMMVARWYRHREEGPIDADVAALGVAGLLQNHRKVL